MSPKLSAEISEYVEYAGLDLSIKTRSDLIQVRCALEVSIDLLSFYIDTDDSCLKKWSKLIDLRDAVDSTLEGKELF